MNVSLILSKVGITGSTSGRINLISGKFHPTSGRVDRNIRPLNPENISINNFRLRLRNFRFRYECHCKSRACKNRKIS